MKIPKTPCFIVNLMKQLTLSLLGCLFLLPSTLTAGEGRGEGEP